MYRVAFPRSSRHPVGDHALPLIAVQEVRTPAALKRLHPSLDTDTRYMGGLGIVCRYWPEGASAYLPFKPS
jgi:hypothetical protein